MTTIISTYYLQLTRAILNAVKELHVKALRLRVRAAHLEAEALDDAAEYASHLAHAVAKEADELADAADTAYRHAEDILTAADHEAQALGIAL